jgi:LPXTG-motif cell wall-anchored protein
MKKLTVTLTLIFGMTMVTFAQNGGLFQRGFTSEEATFQGNRDNFGLMLPTEHGQTGDQDAPLGSGIAILTALGAVYMMAKKRREE